MPPGLVEQSPRSSYRLQSSDQSSLDKTLRTVESAADLRATREVFSLFRHKFGRSSPLSSSKHLRCQPARLLFYPCYSKWRSAN